jgi:hypothetical protein
MKTLLRIALPAAIAAVAFAGLAQGQSSPRADKSRKPAPAYNIVELEASTISLPSSSNGTLDMKACGKCALKSYPVTRATKYYLYAQPVTLPDLTAALAVKPDAYVGVTYSEKTGEILSVRAHAGRVR